MSAASRQNSLLANSDWTRIYQTFKSADFTSYDFETLRKSMIDYLRLYYPEDFNDFVESSEYIALIDVIAFLGQSLAFRTDLNARENFLDTAERRDSILKLARLISYSPKRNVASSGFLKINTVTTTELITDSNGLRLTGVPITWNDGANPNWNEQFSLILNAALVNSQVIGKSGNSQTINGIRNDEYSINLTSGQVPVLPFTATVQNSTMNFEAVSATSIGQPYVYEVEPRPSSKFNILYRNDNQGNGSVNTGFFLYFKQGSLVNSDFNIIDAIPNRTIPVTKTGINNTDVWLYDLTNTSVENTLWTKVPAVAGVNVIYNHLAARNLFQVNTAPSDQIDLIFGDGAFANVPQGNFRLYCRQSAGQTYKITPAEMQNINIVIKYVSRSGNVESLTISASLNYTVSNATAAETIDDIRQKAPQQFYTQGRMITGEDYNIVPYTSFSNVLKVKALNRTSSGVSRYIDVSDTSGKYSSTNIFGQDGYIYSKNDLALLNFTFTNSSNVQQLLQDNLSTILSSKEMQHFYYANMTRFEILNAKWNLSTSSTNSVTGFLYTITGGPAELVLVGSSTSASTSHIIPGAMVQFAATVDQVASPAYFNAQNVITSGYPKSAGDRQYIYSTVMQVIGDGTNGGVGNFANGTGPITMSTAIPTGAVAVSVIPTFANTLSTVLVSDKTIATMPEITSRILAYNNFAIRYDANAVNALSKWKIVAASDISNAAYSLINAGDTTGTAQDSSWIVKFIYTPGVGYSISSRSLQYIFGSILETTFYYDKKVKVYDSYTGTSIQDSINVLKINPPPAVPTPTTLSLGIDQRWIIYDNIVGSDGYEDQNNVLVTFTDSNGDGIPDDPDVFTTIIGTQRDLASNIIPSSLMFFKLNAAYSGFTSYIPVDSSTVVTTYGLKTDIIPNLQLYTIGQIFFATSPADYKFYVYDNINPSQPLTQINNYMAQFGRPNLYFQYRHNSPGYRRIDPTPNNIIDLYLLTVTYAADYTKWVNDSSGVMKEPTSPTTQDLALAYSSLNQVKAMSDSIVFNSAVYKPLFGNKAAAALQARFKVVKNPTVNISDNDIKTSVISAINTYFATSNWDFGETFYFSELSAYLHTALTPNISSIVIVPKNASATFGSLYQINAEANEIMISAATVNDVDVITAITAAQLNADMAVSNNVTLGTIR